MEDEEQREKLRAVFNPLFLTQFQKVVKHGTHLTSEEEMRKKVDELTWKIVDDLPNSVHASLPMCALIAALMTVVDNTDGFTLFRISKN